MIRKEINMSKTKVYSRVSQVPSGQAGTRITKGCLVLEGGAFRGVYTEGVLDAFMKMNLNMECCIGVSAGALNGYNYTSGQIGRAARVNLTYRHDHRYIGPRAVKNNKGVIGFDFLFGDYDAIEPFNMEAFDHSKRRFAVVATSCETGEAAYFEKGTCGEFEQAIRASASMPFVSKEVSVDGHPYLDGGTADKIPFQWAIDQCYDKIIVVTTRPRGFRKKEKADDKHKMAMRIYGKKYPEFARKLQHATALENQQRDELDRLEDCGRVLVVSPSRPIKVGRLEGNMEKLGYLYRMGFHDARVSRDRIKKYLEI